MTDATHWQDCIRAFLHDPPDKALDVKGHDLRASRYQNAAFDVPGDPVRGGVVKPADWLASAIERLPLPKGTIRDCDGNELDPILEQPFNRIPSDKLQRTSPIDGGELTNFTVILPQAQDHSPATIAKREDIIRDLAKANFDHRLRSLALWRLLPQRLADIYTLPGDTRLTDHSILDHADATVACCAALRDGQSASLLVFSLGPVQSFIVQGRSLRDLWTGSYLLSWLTFKAMTPLLDRLGPWSITNPGLRGSPLIDWWMGKQGVHDEKGAAIAAENDDLRWASLPNTFTALVPTQLANELAAHIEKSCRDGWKEICNAVLDRLHQAWGTDWHEHWSEQCDQVWDVRTAHFPVLSISNSSSVVEATKALRETYTRLVGELPLSVLSASDIAASLVKAMITPGYVKEEGQGLWPLANELAQRLLDAGKRARMVPPHAPDNDTREKCALFPGFAVMGPNGDTKANREWWSSLPTPKMVGNIRPSERLSAPGLVKRYAFAAFFSKMLGRDLFPDTREIAFSWWMSEYRKLVAGGQQKWEAWRSVVRGINRRSAEDSDVEWIAHELLDPGLLNTVHWCRDKSDSQAAQKELEWAKRKRDELIISPAKDDSVGLPEPRPYYAVLVGDGDNMGKYLRGEKGPLFSQAYHPTMLAKLREIGVSEEVLGRVRPQGMAAQFTFSRALGEFTVHAGRTIAKSHGTCVYAGGDDVMAVLPVTTALTASSDLARDFRTYVPGATLSVGLAIVHCHEDLRVAIEAARKAEHIAKSSGRDCLCCSIVRRNGDTTQAVSSWKLVPDWHAASVLLATRSERWVHHLLAEQDSLTPLDLKVVWARVKHHILHGEEGSRESRGLGELFDRIRTVWEEWSSDTERGIKKEEQVAHFLTWCQHAAWLARFQSKKMASSEVKP